MNDALGMGPEVRGLLEELAERPERAGLLGAALPFSELLSADIRPAKPLGRDVLEDHLLRAHGNEVAMLLIQASELMAKQSGQLLLGTRDGAGNPRSLDADRWRSRALAQVEANFTGRSAYGALDLLRRALNPRDDLPSARELAVASFRIAPRAEAMIWVGIRTSLEGDPLRAKSILARALGRCATGFLSSLALRNYAEVCCRLGLFHDAVEACRASLRHAADSPGAGIGWFCASLQAGNLQDARRSAAWLRNSVPDDSEILQEHIAYLRSSRMAGIWGPTLEATGLVGGLLPHLPVAAERIVEAFA